MVQFTIGQLVASGIITLVISLLSSLVTFFITSRSMGEKFLKKEDFTTSCSSCKAQHLRDQESLQSFITDVREEFRGALKEMRDDFKDWLKELTKE